MISPSSASRGSHSRSGKAERRTRRPQKRSPLFRRLRCEILEPRTLLSAVPLTFASFDAPNGGFPLSGLIRDSSGDLFGATGGGGGIYGSGTVFEIKPGGAIISLGSLISGSGGADRSGSLLEDANGNLFGMTYSGGASNDGTVFEVVNGSGTVTTLASFSGDNGANPYGSLVEDASGNLFGTTRGGRRRATARSSRSSMAPARSPPWPPSTAATAPTPKRAWSGTPAEISSVLRRGAALGYGTVFEVVNGSNTITTLASFDGSNGVCPQGGLVEDSSGNLFGTTFAGPGNTDLGSVFELANGSNTITTLASFDGSNGAWPQGSLVEDSSGNLFGATTGGFSDATAYGTVFEVVNGSGTTTTLASFNGANGMSPEGGLVEDPSGNLFGTTYQGGRYNGGTAFELANNSGTITTLASFGFTGGLLPTTLILDPSGNLFGTTLGSKPGNGTVFEIAHGSSTINTLAVFYTNASINPTGGIGPAGLVVDPSGNLFGTASWGGASGDGTVFEVVNGSGTSTTLAYFDGSNGANPEGTIVEDANGNLFGSTYQGGSYNAGTVFEVASGSNTITTLASFDGSNGANPRNGVVEDASGNLFGTTDGTVFELAKDSNTITTLASFDGSNGAIPLGTLVVDASGNLFGTTSQGGDSGYGTVFELASGSNTITTLASFDGTNGANPQGSLIEDASGNLFGVTASGGDSGYGTVFKIASNSGTITTLGSFTGAFAGAYTFANPLGLVESPNGILFGTVEYAGWAGGGGGAGAVFEIGSASSDLSVSVTDNVGGNSTTGAWGRSRPAARSPTPSRWPITDRTTRPGLLSRTPCRPGSSARTC